MKRHIQDWQIRGGFTMNNWRLEVKEKNSWRKGEELMLKLRVIVQLNFLR